MVEFYYCKSVATMMQSSEISLSDMTFCLCSFYRVKELGPGDPSDGGPNDGFIPASENPTSPERSLSPSNSDLAMLCTQNVSATQVNIFKSRIYKSNLPYPFWETS